ncbi:MAG: hypothetical protein C5B54_05105 [Acidobacteria bacterium]|nr:MAG: hypothetical protein C5B54_05105 [Acidobacteriota bacterium]
MVGLEVNGNGLTFVTGFNWAGSGDAINCVARGCTNSGFVGGLLLDCRATANQTGGAGFTNTVSCVQCTADANSVPGFATTTTTTWEYCLSVNNTGSVGHGFTMGGSGVVSQCTAFGNQGDGFQAAATAGSPLWVNCLSVANTGYGFCGAGTYAKLVHCYAFNNSLGDFASDVGSALMNLVWSDNRVSLTANPFRNPSQGDFRLNTVAGGGALCQGAGWPGSVPGFVNTTQVLGIGAVQQLLSSLVQRRQFMRRLGRRRRR